MRVSRVHLLGLILGLACAGCTSFATVRSAEVRPGPSLTVQASTTTPPGDDAAWFWSFDCAFECDHPISSFDVALAFGRTGERPYTLGAGVNGLINPYLEGYLQLSQTPDRPYGIGARLGVPLAGWANHQIYGRYDVPFGDGQRLLLNPGLFFHAGNSPNGENPGRFLALVQGLGLELGGETASVVPALAVGFGVGKRESYGREIGPFTSVFGAASLNITFQRRRRTASEP